jgi:hypothetical protein
MGCKKHFFVLFLLFVLISTVAGCGGGVSQTPAGAGGPGSAGTAALTWNAPTTYTNGSPLTNLAGYKIHYGKASGIYTATFTVGNVTNYTLALPAGTYYFTVSAYDALGSESSLSNEVAKTVL